MNIAVSPVVDILGSIYESPLDSDAGMPPAIKAVLDRIPNSTAASRGAIADYVRAEIRDGNWDLYDEVFVFANPHATDSLVGLKAHSASVGANASNDGSDGWAFTAGGYLTTDLDLSSVSNWSQNDALVSIWQETSNQNGRELFGRKDSTHAARIFWSSGTSSFISGLNNPGGGPTLATVSGSAEAGTLMQWARTTGDVAMYRDGISEANGANGSTGVPTGDVIINGYDNNGSITGGGACTWAFCIVGGVAGVDLKAQARNVRDLLRALGTSGARHIETTAPTVLLKNDDWDGYSLSEFTTGATGISGDTVTTTVERVESPVSLPQALVDLGVTEVMKVTVRSSASTTSFRAIVDFNITDTTLDANTGNFGLAFWLADDKCFQDEDLVSTSIQRMGHNQIKVQVSQTGNIGANFADFQVPADVYKRPGWQFLKFHEDVDNKPITDWDGTGAAGPYDYLRLICYGWNSNSKSPSPVAGEAMEYYIAAFTANGSSTPVILYNYDHGNDTMVTIADPYHVTHKVPYTVSCTPSTWADPNSPSSPATDRATVAALQALIDAGDSDIQVTHHFGSGQSSVTTGNAPEHPDLRDLIREVGPSEVLLDYQNAVSQMKANFSGQPDGTYKTISYPVGDMTNATNEACLNAGLRFGRATRLNQSQSNPANSQAPWIFNYPELFVNAIQTNSINMEDNSVDEDYLLQHAIDHIDAVILRGGTLDLWVHRPVANTKQFNITGLTIASDLVLCTGHTFSNGDKVIIYGIAGHDTYSSGSGLNYAHYIVRNVAADQFTLEDPSDSSAVDMAGMPAWSSGGTVTLATTNSVGTTDATLDAVLEYIRTKINSGDLKALTYYDYAHDLGIV